MKRYLLDTNVLLKCLQNKAFKDKLQAELQLFSSFNQAIISIVSIGELKSLAMRNNWGERKIEIMLSFLQNFILIGINAVDITDKYAEIEAYSQGRHPLFIQPLSARNMGKNDLWIAATTTITKATLLTLDKDFEHLSDYFFEIIYPSELK
jgi:tRNA(fMet)-specific endonuclease VapC